MNTTALALQQLTDEDLLAATGGRVAFAGNDPVGNGMPAARRVLLSDVAVTNLCFLGPPEFAGI